MQVETYTMRFANGHSKQATKVTREDGKCVRFVEKLSKKEAVKQAAWANEDAWR